MSDPVPWRAWVTLYTVPSYMRIQGEEHGSSRFPGNPNGWYEESACQSTGRCLEIPSTRPIPVRSLHLLTSRLLSEIRCMTAMTRRRGVKDASRFPGNGGESCLLTVISVTPGSAGSTIDLPASINEHLHRNTSSNGPTLP